jgi:hypothetical protein
MLAHRIIGGDSLRPISKHGAVMVRQVKGGGVMDMPLIRDSIPHFDQPLYHPSSGVKCVELAKPCSYHHSLKNYIDDLDILTG